MNYYQALDDMFDRVINENEEFVITKGDKPVAVVLPIDTYLELKEQLQRATVSQLPLTD